MAVTTLDPRSALVLVDLQQGVVGVGGAPYPVDDVVDRAVRLADAFRTAGDLVVLVRVGLAADGSDATPGRTEQPARSGGPRPEGFDRIVDVLAGHPEDVVVTKRNWGAFHGTDLDLQLRRRGRRDRRRHAASTANMAGESTGATGLSVSDPPLRTAQPRTSVTTLDI